MISLLINHPTSAQAGCGCDKPPPAPASVIPNAAFPGMQVTFFEKRLQVGQTWSLKFQHGSKTVGIAMGTVLSRRNLTDPSGATYTPQLVATLPEMPIGPTRIIASTSGASFSVPRKSFTVIAKPLMVSEQNTDYTLTPYTTAVGTNRALYMSVGGLDRVCKAMSFRAILTNYPFRVSQIAIINAQGFFIDALIGPTTDYFQVEPQTGMKSDILHYFRHSFEQYCADHQPGGSKEVDPADPNWHLDGTPHVDYSTLIFAFSGRLNGRTLPRPGHTSSPLEVTTQLGDGTGAWEVERPEENIDDDEDD